MNTRGWMVVAAAVLALMLPNAAHASVLAGHSGWYWGNPLPQGRTLASISFAGDRGYAVGAFGTVVRTDDAGQTWQGLTTGLTVDLNEVRAISPNTLIAGGGCALRRSDDGGATFQRLPWTASDVRCSSQIASVYFPTPDTGFLLLGNGNLLRTTDGGKTWSRRTAVPATRATDPSSGAQPSDIFFVNADVGFAAIGARVLYRTEDGGATWSPAAIPVNAIWGVHFPTPSTGYAVGDGHQILKSTDGGRSWFELPTEATRQDLRTIRCGDANTCMATTASGTELIRTTDGGLTWQSVTPSTKPLFAVGFASSSRATVVGRDGTTVVTNNAGQTFSRVGDELGGGFGELRAANKDTAYAFGDAGSLARTTDGGQTWQEIDAATSDDVVGVSFPSVQVGFALDAVGQLLRTDNGAQSWEILNTGAGESNPADVLAVSPKNVLLAGPIGLRRSTNGGDSFVQLHQRGITRAGFGALDHSGRFVWAFGPQAIAVSRNGGANWKRVRRPVRKASIVKVDFTSSRTAYVTDSRGTVWRTTSAGRRWGRVVGIGTETSYDLDFADSRHGWASVSEFGDDTSGYVLHTADGGRTWEPQLVDSENVRPGGLAGVTAGNGFALTEANHLFATSLAGSQGARSALTLRAQKRRLAKPGTVRIDGKLSPAEGGEQVVVSFLPQGETRWLFTTVQAATNGTFTVFADLSRSSTFVAQWAGDDNRRGDGTAPLRVAVTGRRGGTRRASVRPARENVPR